MQASAARPSSQVRLCGVRFMDQTEPETEVERDYRNLVHELVRLMGESELFTFVVRPHVHGTNNEAERSLRDSAQARKTGRSSKTICGARRRSAHQCARISASASATIHAEQRRCGSSRLADCGHQPLRSLPASTRPATASRFEAGCPAAAAVHGFEVVRGFEVGRAA